MLFCSLEKNRHDYEDDAPNEALQYMSPNSKGYPEMALQQIFSNCFFFFPFMLCQAKIPHPNKNPFKPWRWNMNFVPCINHYILCPKSMQFYASIQQLFVLQKY